MRVILCELSRVIDHLVCIGANAVDLGALTGFSISSLIGKSLFVVRTTLRRALNRFAHARGRHGEWLLRIGTNVLQFVKKMRVGADEIGMLLTEKQNLDSTDPRCRKDFWPKPFRWGGYTGPLLRAAGVGLDLRKSRTVLHVRSTRFRRSGRNVGRRLRSLHGARCGNARVSENHRASG